MSNIRFYLAMGIPTLAVLIGTSIQVQLFMSLGKHMDRFEHRMDRFEDRMNNFESMLNEMRATFIKDHTERIVRLRRAHLPYSQLN